MHRAFKLFIAVSLMGIVASPVFAEAPAATASPVTMEGHFEKFNEPKSLAIVLVQGLEQSFTVHEDVLIQKLKEEDFKKGDLLIFEVEKVSGKPDSMKNASVKTVQVSRWKRVLALFLPVAGLWLVVGLSLKAAGKDFSSFLVGEDGRYSNSKLQLAVWFGVVLGSYIATILLRWWVCDSCTIAGVDIPVELLELSGLSAATFVGAKTITVWKDNAAKKENPKAGKIAAPEADRKFLTNLLTNDNKQADLGDIQMLIITLMAVMIYMATAFKFLGTIHCVKTVVLPGMDQTMLSFFGLGQVSYLAKKAGGRPGES